MISIVTGLPGASKSYLTTLKAMELLNENHRWFVKSGVVRPVYSNLVFSDKFTGEVNSKFPPDKPMLRYWDDPAQLVSMEDCDVIWEEMGAHVDSRSWESLPLALRAWLQQHRHYGVDIFGNCQDFADIDVAVRRLCGSLMYLIKIVGSPDPSPTKPPIRHVWGVIAKFYLDPRQYNSEEKFATSAFAGIELLDKKVVDMYSMRNHIKPGKYPVLQHRSRECLDCGYKKVIHI